MPTSDDPPADRRQLYIAGLTLGAIVVHLILRYGSSLGENVANVPLWIAYVLGGAPLVWGLLGNLLRREFGSDLLAGLSIVTSVFLGEYLAGALVILMLSGGEALEAYAVSHASSVLKALAKRMPSVAHRKAGTSFEEIALDQVAIGDLLEVLPHEICPVDGTVVEGRGSMDESYLTGEPYQISKTPGSSVISGALNGEGSLTIRADKLAIDSRYAKIMEVMRDSEERRPRMRRLADRLGAWYTPLAVLIALLAWLASGDPVRFLAVLVVATPCPLLIAIPVAIIGSISLAAKRAIIVRDPSILETIDTCQSVIFDKTGTLTYGRPRLHEVHAVAWSDADELLAVAAALEADSTHPIANAVREAAQARGITPAPIGPVNHTVARGLEAEYKGRTVRLGSYPFVEASIPVCFRARVRELLAGTQTRGHVGVTIADGEQCAVLMMADPVRPGAAELVRDLHALGVRPVRMLTGDNRLTAAKVAADLGLDAFDADMLPSDKLTAVATQREAMKGRPRPGVAVIGDGVNDAPALAAADASLAIGTIGTAAAMESADAVLLGEHLGAVPWAVGLARRTRRTITTNIGLSLLVMAGMAAMTLIGSRTGRDVPLSVGVLAHEGGTLLVVLNSLLLLGYGNMKSNTVSTAPATTGRPYR